MELLARSLEDRVLGSQTVAELRFVDLKRMRLIGGDDLRLTRRGVVAVTAWPSPRRVLAVVQTPGCCIGRATLFVADPFSRQVLAQRQLEGSLQAFARFRGGLVLLLAPPASVGPSRLGLVDRRGAFREVVVADIPSGQTPVRPGATPGRQAHPGLALDAAGARAFVVGAGARVAEVDLRSLRVTYHALRWPVSLLGRLRDWLEPQAQADVPPEGPVRRAHWLGGGLVAVVGSDWRYVGGRLRELPAGLELIDTRRWTIRTLHEGATAFSVAAGTLLAYVPAAVYGAKPIGLVGYDFGGERRFQLFDGKEAGPALIMGARAYVVVGRFSWPGARVVDVRSRRVLGEHAVPRFELVSPERMPAWPYG